MFVDFDALIVSSMLKTRHAASTFCLKEFNFEIYKIFFNKIPEAAVIELILTTAGSQTVDVKLSEISSLLISTPYQICPSECFWRSLFKISVASIL